MASWQKGQSGNLKGRPKRDREVRYLEITLSTVTFADWKEIIGKAMEQARGGDKDARKFLAEYLVGKPLDKIEITERNKIGEISDEEFAELELRLGRSVGSDHISSASEEAGEV